MLAGTAAPSQLKLLVPSVRTEVVVGRCEHHGAIDFNERLTGLVGFFHVAIFHFSYTILGGCECCGEGWFEH